MEAKTKVFTAVLDFPDNPQPGEVYVYGSTIYTWQPPRWTAISAVQGPPGPEGPPGPTVTDEGEFAAAT